MSNTPEDSRLTQIAAGDTSWRTWGTYLAERAWATVREDYSPDGSAWNYFPHDHARMRAYRWNEDGLAGFCDNQQQLCLGIALWNGQDPILKERLWGLAGDQGNHGEDVKELYFYEDATPTHSYNRMRYLYPQAAFPYADLIQQSQQGDSPLAGVPSEVELQDVLRNDLMAGKYFQVDVEYAKAAADDILMRIRVTNHGPVAAPIHVLPQLWFRNTWSWGTGTRRQMRRNAAGGISTDATDLLGALQWAAVDDSGDKGTLLFTENETNWRRLWPNSTNDQSYAKDAFHLCVVPAERAALQKANGRVLTGLDAVNPAGQGSKAAAWFQRTLAPGQTWEIRVRMAPSLATDPFADFTALFTTRQSEANAFYTAVQPAALDADRRLVQRQAFAGLLWSRQFYSYDVNTWLNGDPGQIPPPASRKQRNSLERPGSAARNVEWRNLYSNDVITMPDAWEYPWFAAWDLAFHCAAIAPVDLSWAKSQLLLLLQPNFLHPNGQIPAYEWEFSDVNPPVAGWSGMDIYRREKALTSQGDKSFLAQLLTGLIINYTWWMNREDLDGDDVFQGGFLGLDNISIVDRSSLAPGETIEQSDSTAWMAMYAANIFEMAVELASTHPEGEYLAIIALDHYIRIATVLHDPASIDETLKPLWDETDGFFYDHCILNSNDDITLRIKSMSGLIPLFATACLSQEALTSVPRVQKHLNWIQIHHPECVAALPELFTPNAAGDRLLSLVPHQKLNRLTRVLSRVFDDTQFLCPFGVRSLSKEHETHPFVYDQLGQAVYYQSGPSTGSAKIKGGNSNWRGPVWMPVNALMVHALRTLADYHGSNVQVTISEGGAQRTVDLKGAAQEISNRLVDIFTVGKDGNRPVNKQYDRSPDPLFARQDWKDQVLFFEYFDGDTGKGLGASHQTGWTAMVAPLIQDSNS